MNRHRENVEMYVVDASDSSKEVNWRILTTLPVGDLGDAIKVLDIYRKRWNVELYFKSLKSGCNIEDRRLGEAGKLVKYASLMSAVHGEYFG